jgi:hypothetical protein
MSVNNNNNNSVTQNLFHNLNSLRSSYMEIFNEILDTSLNINCICKTSSSVLGESSNELLETEKDRIQINNVSIHRRCDLSCFENMKYVHFTLKNVFLQSSSNDNHQRQTLSLSLDERFDRAWQSYKFLLDNPQACDYYGTTIFHYAACDNNLLLLKYSLKKHANGVYCTDTKGMTPLMRAVQRNNRECVEFLLNETESNINGSRESVHSPLWFGVVNGYNETCRLLLNFNAYPSLIQHTKTFQTASQHLNNYDYTAGLNFSLNSGPLRASIVYSR